MTVSPDGKHIYSAAFTDSAVAVFSRDSTTGALTFVEFQRDGVGGVDGLNNAYSVTVSPDGKHLYATGFNDDAVAVFSRDSTTGVLTFVEFHKDGVGGVDGLDGPISVTVSPGGKHLYSAAFTDDAVAVFSRDSTTGALTFVEVQKDGLGGVDGLDSARSVTVSPDGNHLYAASQTDSAVAVFSRDSTTGALTFVEVQRDGVGGVDGLNGGRSVAVSPGGKHLYATGFDDDAVAVFTRDSTTGALTFVEVHKDGVGTVDGLDGARSVAVSPDGKLLYASSEFDDAVAVFSRDSTTGTLTFVDLQRDGVGGVDGLDGAMSVTVSPEGKHLYAAGYFDNAVAVFSVASTDTPQSSPFTVTKTGDTSDGFCGTLDCSLREAISSGDSGDTVNIPTGTYTLTLGTELTIDKNLTLNGAGSGDTIIQAATSPSVADFRVFNITGANVAISGVAVQNGNPSSDGGGIYNKGTMTLTNSTVSGNTANANFGGGIRNFGTLTVTNTTISGNTANFGGGISHNGTLTVTNSTVSDNTAGVKGGGIYNSGTLILTDSTVSGNTGGSSTGGGIHNDGTLTLANSTVSNNTVAVQGGGITNNGTVTLTNSTVSGNSTTGRFTDGGGIYNNRTLTLINSTVSSNTAVEDGGGIYNSSTGTLPSTLTLTNSTVSGNTATSGTGGGIVTAFGTTELVNTIIAGNTASSAPDCSGSPTSLGHNLIGTSDGCSFTPATGDLVNVDPKLDPLSANGGPTKTHALMPGSPAIDSGDDTVLGSPHNLTTDQRGDSPASRAPTWTSAPTRSSRRPRPAAFHGKW